MMMMMMMMKKKKKKKKKLSVVVFPCNVEVLSSADVSVAGVHSPPNVQHQSPKGRMYQCNKTEENVLVLQQPHTRRNIACPRVLISQCAHVPPRCIAVLSVMVVVVKEALTAISDDVHHHLSIRPFFGHLLSCGV